jgi:hypothetical protein
VSGGSDYSKSTLSIRKEMNKLSLKLCKAKSKDERKGIYDEFKHLKKDLIEIEKKHIERVFASADIICCTLTSASDKKLRNYIHNKMND